VYDRILFPTDGSDGAATALDHALDLAAVHDAAIHVLFVVDTTYLGAAPRTPRRSSRSTRPVTGPSRRRPNGSGNAAST